jgi:hypothetical protein
LENNICDFFQENGDPGNSHRYKTGLFPEHFAAHREYTKKLKQFWSIDFIIAGLQA